jgi:hypothetical protein
MDMNTRKIVIGFGLLLMMSSATGAAFAQRAEGMPPPMFHMLGMSGFCADQQYLYVMAGGKIIQYDITDLKLVKTVDLPKPVPPSSVAPSGTGSNQPPPPPPPMAGLLGLWAGESFLYVLAGPVIYQYSTPDLTLQTTVELPKPEFPQTTN